MIKQQSVLALGRFWGSAHAVLLMATLIWAGHAVALRMSVGEISPVLLMQLSWIAGFSLLLVYAAQYTTAVNLGIMQGVAPAVVMLLGWLIYRTRIGGLQFFGLCSSLTGILVLISAGSSATILALRFNLGNFLMVAACLCYGANTVALA